MLARVGLVIGYVISRQQGKAVGLSDAASNSGAAERLKALDELRSESLITGEEYQAKRKQIVDEI